MTLWKPTIRIQLAQQQAEPEQPELFAFALPGRPMPECDHLADAWQTRFDGGIDRMCTSCGAVLQSTYPSAEKQ